MDNVRYHLNELVKIGLIKRTAADKRIKRKIDDQARYFYSLNPEFIGFYYIYPRDWKEMKQSMPTGRYDLLVLLNYEILNMEGDINVSENFIFVNTGEKAIEGERHWFFTERGFITFRELGIRAFDGDGNELSVECIDENDNPRKQVNAYIHFSKQVKKDEIYSYWYTRKRRAALMPKGDRVYYDTNTPINTVIITVSMPEDVKGIRKLAGYVEDLKTGAKVETGIQPFWYRENERIKLLWFIPDPITKTTYTMEWKAKL